MILPHTSLENFHFPVMLDEVIKICKPENGGDFIDCTFGGGSYSEEILKYPNTKVIAFDRDIITKPKAERLKNKYSDRFNFHNEKFGNIDKVLNNNFKADIIIFDLGLSNFQLNDLERGFSFNSTGRIDMGMGLSSISAEHVVNNFDDLSLKKIIKILGEEKEASKIVRNILKTRKVKKISRVTDLVEIIKRSKKKDFKKKINICTKTFQALRIFVNKEITELIDGIAKATKHLKFGGKIIIVSFHSLEDKIVKHYFQNYSAGRPNPSRYFPQKAIEDNNLFEKYKNRILKPTASEIKKNPASRSAKLRFAIRNKRQFFNPSLLKLKFNKYIEIENLYA